MNYRKTKRTDGGTGMEQDNGSKEILAEKSVPSSEKDASADPEATCAALREENAALRQEIALLKKALYGQKSEKTKVIGTDFEQVSFFNEAEKEAEISPKNAEKEIEIAAHKRKQKRTHEEMLSSLPVEEVIHEAEERTCPECGSEMKPVGKEFIRDELVYVPAKLFVRKHYTEVLKCPSCGSDESKDGLLPDVQATVFRKAAAPAPMIPHSFCSPELLAHILFEKYVQAVPLYRQEKEFKALGVDLPRNTMANWIVYMAEVYAKPVWNAMKADLLKSHVIHADETVVQVLHEAGRNAKTDSRMWVYAAPAAGGRSNILFEYCQTRNGDNAVRFLGDYKGYLVCDGYDGYNKLTNVSRCGCFAHVRRKFVEALPTDKELVSGSRAAIGVEWCSKLFDLETEYEELLKKDTGTDIRETRRKLRQERSKPVLDGFFAWVETVFPSGGTKLAKAVQYAKNEKQYLYRFLEDPDIPIHNNRAENAIRPFVVGRKNWLFSDSPKGAEASAIIYSLAATAAANGIPVEQFFTDLLRHPQNPPMPWN